MTAKKMQYMEQRENRVREWVDDSTLTVGHVQGKVNPADLFTKETRDGVHFHKLRDSFMSRADAFLPGESPVEVAAAALALTTRALPSPFTSGTDDFLTFLTRNRGFAVRANVSHLSSAGRQLIGEHVAVV